jgi:hypothetical protein
MHYTARLFVLKKLPTVLICAQLWAFVYTYIVHTCVYIYKHYIYIYIHGIISYIYIYTHTHTCIHMGMYTLKNNKKMQQLNKETMINHVHIHAIHACMYTYFYAPSQQIDIHIHMHICAHIHVCERAKTPKTQKQKTYIHNCAAHISTHHDHIHVRTCVYTHACTRTKRTRSHTCATPNKKYSIYMALQKMRFKNSKFRYYNTARDPVRDEPH